MHNAIRDRRPEVLALGPNLHAWANALTRNPAEAQALVFETLAMAGAPEEQPSDDTSTHTWVHRLLRRNFYSIARDRGFRRSSSAAVTELGYARKLELQAQAAVSPG